MDAYKDCKKDEITTLIRSISGESKKVFVAKKETTALIEKRIVANSKEDN